MHDDPDDLMTGIDAARILDLSVDMVRLLARDGRLPSLRTIRGVRLYRRGDVERVAEERRETATLPKRGRPRKTDGGTP